MREVCINESNLDTIEINIIEIKWCTAYKITLIKTHNEVKLRAPLLLPN